MTRRLARVYRLRAPAIRSAREAVTGVLSRSLARQVGVGATTPIAISAVYSDQIGRTCKCWAGASSKSAQHMRLLQTRKQSERNATEDNQAFQLASVKGHCRFPIRLHKRTISPASAPSGQGFRPSSQIRQSHVNPGEPALQRCWQWSRTAKKGRDASPSWSASRIRRKGNGIIPSRILGSPTGLGSHQRHVGPFPARRSCSIP